MLKTSKKKHQRTVQEKGAKCDTPIKFIERQNGFVLAFFYALKQDYNATYCQVIPLKDTSLLCLVFPDTFVPKARTKRERFDIEAVSKV